MEDDLPARSHPVHKLPVGRHNSPTILFVTVNIHAREHVLGNNEFHDIIRAVWSGPNAWQVGYYVIMPDHIHLFCAPGQNICTVNHWVKFWKEKSSKLYPPIKGKWQRDCWDTQMRTAGHYRRKLDYVENNPVRQGLVSESSEWPYQGHIGHLPWI